MSYVRGLAVAARDAQAAIASADGATRRRLLQSMAEQLRAGQAGCAHGRTGAAVEQRRPQRAVFLDIGAQGAEASLVILGAPDRESQLVELLDLVLCDIVEQRLLRRVMPEEGGIMNPGFGADVADGDLVEGLALEQCEHGIPQRLAGTQCPCVTRR
jgi:hypothetical protein